MGFQNLAYKFHLGIYHHISFNQVYNRADPRPREFSFDLLWWWDAIYGAVLARLLGFRILMLCVGWLLFFPVECARLGITFGSPVNVFIHDVLTLYLFHPCLLSNSVFAWSVAGTPKFLFDLTISVCGCLPLFDSILSWLSHSLVSSSTNPRDNTCTLLHLSFLSESMPLSCLLHPRYFVKLASILVKVKQLGCIFLPISVFTYLAACSTILCIPSISPVFTKIAFLQLAVIFLFEFIPLNFLFCSGLVTAWCMELIIPTMALLLAAHSNWWVLVMRKLSKRTQSFECLIPNWFRCLFTIWISIG